MPQTRSRYPFAVSLEVTCTVKDADLDISRLPLRIPAMRFCRPRSVAIGFNLAVAAGTGQAGLHAHFLRHDRRADRVSRRAGTGTPQPTPIDGKILRFRKNVRCRRDYYGPPGEHVGSPCRRPRTVSIEMSWDGFRELGVWVEARRWCRSSVSSHGTVLPARWISTAIHRQARVDAYRACRKASVEIPHFASAS